MGLLAKVLCIVLLISIFVSIIFFGRLPALKNTPIGALQRFLTIRIPKWFKTIDQRVTNGRLFTSVAGSARFLMNERHPTVLIGFIALLLLAEYMWLPTVFPALPLPTQIVGVAIVAAPYIFLFLSATTDPGSITAENHAENMHLYPYDHMNYHPAVPCRTCHFNKPARSKHCSVCKSCVARADHHCVFINSCVGYGNMHWFMLLLFSTLTLTGAGAYLGTNFMVSQIQETFTTFTFTGKGFSWEHYFQFWIYGLDLMPVVGGVTLLCIFTTPLVLILSWHAIYQLWAGITTNESAKWGNVKMDIADGWLYKRPMQQPRRWHDVVEPYVPWPKESNTVILSHEKCPDENDPLFEGRGVGPWTKVESIHELQNIYDAGVWHGLKDIFLSRPLRTTKTA